MILCGFQVMQANPTYLPVPSYTPSAPATRHQNKTKFRRKTQIRSKETSQKEESHHGSCSVAPWVTPRGIIAQW